MSAEALNALTSRLVEGFARASWEAGVVVAIVWVVCRVWKKIPNSFRFALWFVACLRFLISLSALQIAVPVLPSPVQKPLSTIASAPVEASFVLPTELSQIRRDEHSVPMKEPVEPQVWLAAAWLAGAILVGAVSARQVGKTLRLVRKSVASEDAELVELAKEVASCVGLKSLPRLLVPDELGQVMTVGLFHPAAILPRLCIEASTPDEQRMILAHEFEHIRRRDAWLGLVPQVTQIVFFFHPLVWVACREFDLAREAACDEAAIGCLKIGSDQYARLLLKLGTRSSTGTTLCTPGVSSHFRLLRRRIAMLERTLESTRRTWRRSSALLAIGCVFGVSPIALVHAQSVSTTPVPALTRAIKRSAPVTTVVHKTNPPQTTPKPKASQKGSKVPAPSVRLVSVFQVKYASAAKIARILNKAASINKVDAKASSDDYTNSVIIAASASVMPQMKDLAKQLDEKPIALPQPVQKVATQTTVLQLQHAKAATLEQIIQSLYSQGKLQLTVDVRTNSLIILAPSDSTEVIKELVKRLDVPADPAKGPQTEIKPWRDIPSDASQPPKKMVKVWPLKYAKANDLMKTIQSMKDTGIDFISSDPRTNSLVVRIAEDKVKDFQNLLAQLDIQTP